MKALVFEDTGTRTWSDVPDPTIVEPTDAIIRVTTTTICGTDLHILKGDVPETTHGTVLGHEAVGEVIAVGSSVRRFKVGDRVLASCISSCGSCDECRRQRYGLCTGGGGWILGHTIDGVQAEYARIPFADTSMYSVPDGLSDQQVIFLADVLPTAFEVGVLASRLQPGETMAVVGAGPIGLGTIMTAQLYSPGRIVAIDLSEKRLARAIEFGASGTVCNDGMDAAAVLEAAGVDGFDVAIEAVGVPASFELCADLVNPGGRIANIGVHGKPVTLHLERLWIRGITITAALVDTNTIPQLLRLVESGRLHPEGLSSHSFPLDHTGDAYDTFGAAATTDAMKVSLECEPVPLEVGTHREVAVHA